MDEAKARRWADRRRCDRLDRAKARWWTTADLATLRRDYPTKGSAYVGKLVGRTAEAVKIKAYELGIRRCYE